MRRSSLVLALGGLYAASVSAQTCAPQYAQIADWIDDYQPAKVWCASRYGAPTTTVVATQTIRLQQKRAAPTHVFANIGSHNKPRPDEDHEPHRYKRQGTSASRGQFYYDLMNQQSRSAWVQGVCGCIVDTVTKTVTTRVTLGPGAETNLLVDRPNLVHSEDLYNQHQDFFDFLDPEDVDPPGAVAQTIHHLFFLLLLLLLLLLNVTKRPRPPLGFSSATSPSALCGRSTATRKLRRAACCAAAAASRPTALVSERPVPAPQPAAPSNLPAQPTGFAPPPPPPPPPPAPGAPVQQAGCVEGLYAGLGACQCGYNVLCGWTGNCGSADGTVVTPTASWVDCGKLCDDNSDCTAWTYSYDSGLCTEITDPDCSTDLFQTIADPNSALGVYAGTDCGGVCLI
ncbi:uncharacterized protein BKCO1_4400021 [Diplodia corticola]|uniref:Apple domain-containing protein n=1 Tax=Diplodia corticola TaxID=236234 RepID=A0A1J9QV08_9PEZI|nr:uncharacterized protein BKCO1_4400021 [Diplodia corticola]OJD31810.1 hypothetical protein BKCO1_4400021 [Diplodia corticola]